MKYLVSFLFLFLHTSVHAQDSIKKLVFIVGFDFWTSQQLHATNAKVSMPQPIRQRRKSSTELPVSFDTISDNPFRHGAMNATLKTKTSFQNKVFLFADLYAEHRGVSYGMFDRNNTTIYPIIYLSATDTLKFFADSIILKTKVGQFINERLDEGLMMYNIDVQGYQVEAAINNWKFQYTIYGDLYDGIGLNIDDLHAFSLSRVLKDQGYMGFSWNIAAPPFYTARNNFSLNVFGRKKLRNGSLYAQAGVRPVKANIFFKKSLIERVALVAGYTINKRSKKLTLSATAEARYYGQMFTFGYSNNGLRYRNPAADIDSMYANTTGKYLYPLRKFETPFSQWNVFTEYVGYNVGALSLSGASMYHLSEKIKFNFEGDFNFIGGRLGNQWSDDIDKTTNFLYPFFKAEVCYKPAENVLASIFLTNKAMNLDVHYPTHYLLSQPCFGVRISASF